VFHLRTVSSEFPHWITNQCIGLLVTVPQISHLNSCSDAICPHGSPNTPLFTAQGTKECSQQRITATANTGARRGILVLFAADARDFHQDITNHIPNDRALQDELSRYDLLAAGGDLICDLAARKLL
jgi:hypothetical protein